jgi:pimeloyl-ACP methyl ester carboxylesterase
VSSPFPTDSRQLPTLPYLDYQPCYTGFQCARLELPLDYFNGTTNATISLAVMRKPAAVPVTSPYYGDAIILNPGGPGGSGVQFLQGIGGALQTLVDSQEETEGAKYFDIISFDPRGIQYSSPNVRCFNNSRLYDSWVERISEEGSVTSSDAALGRLWSMSKASGASCALAGDEDIKRFVTTASVATDMIRLTEAHGAWREKEAKRLLAKSLGKHSAIIVPDRVKYKPSKELIQYWGFSYGTYLGATFASMYPGRIHRLILDGVVDAEDYAKALWYDNLEDTEKNINLFYYHCARVGPSGCALAEEGSTAGNIEAVVKKVIADLYHNPLPIVGPNPDVVTYSGVRMTILIATYSPLVQFPRLATFLAMIRDGQKQGYMLSDKSAYVIMSEYRDVSH